MKILIAGGSGFIGSHLGLFLQSKGHRVELLTRQNNFLFNTYDKIIYWDQLDKISSKDFHMIINLCGYDIAQKKWSAKIKTKIITSRIESTQKIIKFIGKSDTWLLNASAIGFYPFSSEPQDECLNINKNISNLNFCQEITKNWEKVVNDSLLKNKTIMRFGVVLGDQGMLTKVLPTAKIGLGSVIGTGHQYLSWVHIDDLCRAIIYLMNNDTRFKDQAVNITSPSACTQEHFINTLCRLLKRPRWMSMPKWLVNRLFGQMGKELLLSSHNIKPKKLLDSGFEFRYPNIELALEDLLKTGVVESNKSSS